MAAHGICFNFYYQPKPWQSGQNGCQAFVDTCLAAIMQKVYFINAKKNMV